jgi:hypothetical protein
MWIVNALYPKLLQPLSSFDWLAPTAEKGAMDRAIFIAAEFHWSSPEWFEIEGS